MIPTLYDPDVLRAITSVADATPDTTYVANYSPLCEPPSLPPLANVTLVSHELVPPGRVTLSATANGWSRAEMREVTAVRFGIEAVEVEYLDAEHGEHTAITIPMDEHYADELEVARGHLGILVDQAVTAMEKRIKVEVLSATEIRERRTALLNSVGGDEDALRGRARVYALTAIELAALDEIDGLDYLNREDS
jgi:hypothetical protein